jgi:hypothetical protein
MGRCLRGGSGNAGHTLSDAAAVRSILQQSLARRVNLLVCAAENDAREIAAAIEASPKPPPMTLPTAAKAVANP